VSYFLGAFMIVLAVGFVLGAVARTNKWDSVRAVLFFGLIFLCLGALQVLLSAVLRS
jgi:FtsH-binding integral membrane protein